jgi:alkanesulfonate monooxygenase SsuD/methylene tetrahydromethanopterin reductase-like flavin-dependent oxidoreductase (luciferase family)
MIIGLGLDGRLGLSVAELGELGGEAARLGFESLWTPAGGVPDAFHVCARWASSTAAVNGSSLRMGTGVVSAARSWHPLSLAAQTATLAQLSDGQFILGIGTGGYGPEFFANVNLPNKPIAVIRDYVAVLRALLAGENLDYEGPALKVHGALGVSVERAPIYIAALGPQMLRLAGEIADGASLNWANPQAIAESAAHIRDGATKAGRDPKDVTISMYIRVCIDDDVDAAREAFATQVLGYAMARPGQDLHLGYRGHFARMGFDAVLKELEAQRDKGVKVAELTKIVPDELLHTVGYFGPAEGAAKRYAELSRGLDETIVRVISAGPGKQGALAAMHALNPDAIRNAS